MDQIKTGNLIHALRLERGMTQLTLAQALGVSSEAVSKWECGGGAPDISLLPTLAETLGVSARALLRGELGENEKTNGNLKKLYPEWDMLARLPFFAHGRLLWYCTQHGLFTQAL